MGKLEEMMTKRIKIRQADAYDVMDLAGLLAQGVKEQGEHIWYPSLSMNRMRRISHILAVIDKGYVVIADMLVVVGNEPTGQRGVIGAIGMSIERDSWSDDWVLSNEWTYVLPDYRDTEVYVNMMTAVEDFADSKIHPDTGFGLPIIMSNISGKSAETKDALLKRRGYQFGGGNFVRAPHHEQEKETDHGNEDTDVAGGRQ